MKKTSQRALVMTIIGQDKPGLVESVSAIVAEQNGNWLESRMSRLGGYFAGILRVEVPSENETALSTSLRTLSSRGLDIVIHADKTESVRGPHKTQRLEIVGQDRPGIVRQITQAIASQGVNVEEFHSETCSAAMSGETLFLADITILLPESCDTAGLRRELEKIASDLIVDIKFTEPE